MARPKTASKRVPPREKARAALARTRDGESHTVTRCMLAHMKRIARLEDLVVADLESEDAPWRVVRWVAWGKGKAQQRQRCDLVIHLRRSIDTPCGGWLDEHALKAAWDLLCDAIASARKRGLAQPSYDEIETGAYERAVRAADTRAKEKRGERGRERATAGAASPAIVAPTPLTLTAEERALLQKLLERAA